MTMPEVAEAPAVEAPVSEEQDLAAGFAAVTGTEPVAPEPAQEGAIEQAQAELDDVPTQEPQAETPAPWAAELGALRSQIDGFEKTVRNIAGNVGGLKSQLQKLSSLPSGTPAAENAAKIVEESIREHIASEYPELSDSLTKSLTKIVSSLVIQSAPAPQVDADAIETRVMARVERRALDRAHPKWEDEIALKDETGQPIIDQNGKRLPSPVFREWLSTKDEKYRDTFVSTVDSDFLIPALDDFKKYRASKSGAAPAQEPAQATEVAAPVAAPSKQRRLAAAVTPSGVAGKQTGRTQLTEDEEFAAGFKSVRGR